MSIATDQEVKNLRKEVEILKGRVLALESPPVANSWIDDMKEAYQRKFGKAPHHLLKAEGLMKALGITEKSL